MILLGNCELQILSEILFSSANNSFISVCMYATVVSHATSVFALIIHLLPHSAVNRLDFFFPSAIPCHLHLIYLFFCLLCPCLQSATNEGKCGEYNGGIGADTNSRHGVHEWARAAGWTRGATLGPALVGGQLWGQRRPAPVQRHRLL